MFEPASPATLKSYAFTIVLAGVDELSDAMIDAIYVAGCDDAGVGSCEGLVTVDFDREAESLGDAIGSAVKDVAKAGLAVARVEVDRRARHESSVIS